MNIRLIEIGLWKWCRWFDVGQPDWRGECGSFGGEYVTFLREKRWMREPLAFLLWGLALVFAIPPVQSTKLSKLDLWPSAGIGFLLFLTSHVLLRGHQESASLTVVRCIGYLALCWLILERVRFGAL